MPFLLLRCLRRRSVEFFEKIQEQIRENSAAHERLWTAGIAPSGYEYREYQLETFPPCRFRVHGGYRWPSNAQKLMRADKIQLFSYCG
jgi:hypothetical protein